MLTKDEKKEIVQGLCKSIADKLCKHIDSDHLPEEYDGFEIRWMLEDIIKFEASRGPSRRARYRAYRKSILRADYAHNVLR